MKNTSLRHGDFTLLPTDKIEGEKIKLTKNEFTFGEGEVTGHMHTLHTEKIDDMDWYKCADGSYIVTLKKDGYATHPEHSMKVDLVVPAGTYRVYQRREKDYFQNCVRKVID